MTNKLTAVLPLLLPLMKDGRALENANRLVYRDGLTLYYSYQHPIAFLCRDQLTVRDGFWDRRRGNRPEHVQSILADVRRQLGTNSLNAFASSKNFFEDLAAETPELMLDSPPAPATKPDKKRRVRL